MALIKTKKYHLAQSTNVNNSLQCKLSKFVGIVCLFQKMSVYTANGISRDFFKGQR